MIWQIGKEWPGNLAFTLQSLNYGAKFALIKSTFDKKQTL
jgi:hypothetical protein